MARCHLRGAFSTRRGSLGHYELSAQLQSRVKHISRIVRVLRVGVGTRSLALRGDCRMGTILAVVLVWVIWRARCGQTCLSNASWRVYCWLKSSDCMPASLAAPRLFIVTAVTVTVRLFRNICYCSPEFSDSTVNTDSVEHFTQLHASFVRLSRPL